MEIKQMLEIDYLYQLFEKIYHISHQHYRRCSCRFISDQLNRRTDFYPTIDTLEDMWIPDWDNYKCRGNLTFPLVHRYHRPSHCRFHCCEREQSLQPLQIMKPQSTGYAKYLGSRNEITGHSSGHSFYGIDACNWSTLKMQATFSKEADYKAGVIFSTLYNKRDTI